MARAVGLELRGHWSPRWSDYSAFYESRRGCCGARPEKGKDLYFFYRYFSVAGAGNGQAPINRLWNPLIYIFHSQNKTKSMLQNSSVALYAQDQSGMTRVVTLVDQIPTFSSASNSVVLSAAAYISWKYPTLQHPAYPGFDLSSLPEPTSDYKSADLSLHPLFEGWCDLISTAMFEGHAIRKNNDLYVAIPVSIEYLNQIRGHDLK